MILQALTLLGDAAMPDPGDLTRALWALRQAGQEDAARAIALHYMLT